MAARKGKKRKGYTLFKRNGKGPWRIALFDWDPTTAKRRRREVSTRQGDRAVADQIAQRLLDDARLHKQEAKDLGDLRRRGLSDAVAERLVEAARIPLTAHLEDFRAMLEGKGNTAKHVSMTVADCKEVLAACGFVYPPDLCPVKLARYVTELKTNGRPARVKKRRAERPPEGLSPRSINRRLTAVKGFVHWLCVTERVRTDPLQQVAKLNARVDRRKVRRALSDDGIVRLVAAAENGAPVLGMGGHYRAMLCRVELGTGLRAGELRSLTPSSFALGDLNRSSVAVEAAYSKHRRRDVLPLRRDLAEVVAQFIAGKPSNEPIFPTLPQKTAKMMQVDLDRARPWIPYKDAAGRINVDFHSLRTTFITPLARCGVAPAMAKSLARHSTITLTLDVYTDIGEADERAALAKLPALPTGPAAGVVAAKRATGTEG